METDNINQEAVDTETTQKQTTQETTEQTNQESTNSVQEQTSEEEISKNDYLKKISKDFKINAFEPKEVESKLNELTSLLKEKETEFNTNLASTKTELESLKLEYDNFKNESNSKYNELQDSYLLNKFNVPEDFKDEFLTLSKSKVSDKVTLEAAADLVKEKIGKAWDAENTVTEVVIGNNKSSLSSSEKESQEILRLRSL